MVKLKTSDPKINSYHEESYAAFEVAYAGVLVLLKKSPLMYEADCRVESPENGGRTDLTLLVEMPVGGV